MQRHKRVNLDHARHILAHLDSRGSISRTRLEKGFPESHASFNNVFDFLRTAGYIAKASTAHRAPYTITAKGKRFLESL